MRCYFSSCAILWLLLPVYHLPSLPPFSAPLPGISQGFPIDDVFRNWGVGRCRLDVGRLPLDEDGTCCELFTATGGHSIYPPPPFYHSCDSHCWLSFLLSTGAGAARPCTAITHCRKHLNVFMCKRLSLKLPAALSFCSPQAVSYRLFRSPSSPLFLFLLSLVLHSFPLLSITATKMFPLLS